LLVEVVVVGVYVVDAVVAVYLSLSSLFTKILVGTDEALSTTK
jgi:hypothetical protein